MGFLCVFRVYDEMIVLELAGLDSRNDAQATRAVLSLEQGLTFLLTFVAAFQLIRKTANLG